jgi:AcrR family transcriptional regulator
VQVQSTRAARVERAKPLSVEDRRVAIIDAVIPLLIEHGRAVTTRQIADAAGIAEGTIFRAFADKDELIDAAVEKFLDPAPLHAALRAIDPELPLEQKINDLLFYLRNRMTGIFGIMNAVGMSGRPPGPPGPESFYDIIGEVLRPDFERLQVSTERIAQFLRLVAFASAVPQFNEGQSVPTDELAKFITYGIAGSPAERKDSNAA